MMQLRKGNALMISTLRAKDVEVGISNQCPFYEAKRYKRDKKGHIAQICQSKKARIGVHGIGAAINSSTN